MPPGLAVLAEMGHYGSVIPLAMCLFLQLRRRDADADGWLLAGAFFVSFIADQIAVVLAVRGINNWWLSYLYAPLQFGLMLAVVTRDRAVRAVGMMGLAALAMVSVLRGTLGAPETMVQVVGGLMVGWLAWGAEHIRRYRPAILVYCVGGAPWMLLMGAIDPYAPIWRWCWGAYVVTRVLALVLMGWALWRVPLQVEGHDGQIVDSAARERGARLRDLSGGHRPVVATPPKR